MPWITTAPMPSGIFEKHSWIASMMPSFSALRFAGRLRPTDRTGPEISTLSSAEGSAVAADAAFAIDDCVLFRIVILYNDLEWSQSWTWARCAPSPACGGGAGGGGGSLRVGIRGETPPPPRFARHPPRKREREESPGRRVGSQHLMHVDHDTVGVAGADADEQVLHQPAIFFSSGLEFRHRAKIDQRGIDRLTFGDPVQ